MCRDDFIHRQGGNSPEEGHGYRARTYIAKHTARVCDRSSGEEGAEEACDHDGLEIFCSGRREGEADGDEHGGQHRDPAAIDFREGRPEQRAETKAEEEDCGAEGGYLGAHLELLGDLARACRIGRRGPRCGHGDEAIQQGRGDFLVSRPVQRPVGVVETVEVDQVGRCCSLVGQGVSELRDGPAA